MKRRRLGRTGMYVSDICMGTMTFGSYCDEKLSFQILDKAVEMGVNFFDTAEIYPVPPNPSYVFETEKIVGKWLETKPRESVIIATKVAGPGHMWFPPPIRSGNTAFDRVHIRKAIEGSLKRLRTDYIDLYQTHWPDRGFGYEETLETLTELSKEGKIRAIGCSNESPWGLMKSLQVAKENGFMRYETIQNNFSFANRRDLDNLAEVCRFENVSHLPYSPIAGGVLSGKYNAATQPENARFTKYRNEGERQMLMVERFVNPKTLETTKRFSEIAQELSLTPAQLAISWSKQHDFVGSTIIGATTLQQTEENLAKADFVIPNDVMKRLDQISNEILYPMG